MAVYKFRVHDERRDYVQEVDGQMIAKVTTRQPGKAQVKWNEMELYELPESGRWLLHRVGLSLIYHTSPTICKTFRGKMRGIPASGGDLPDGAEPCPACNPPYPEELGDRIKIRFEWPRHGFVTCPDAGSVYDSLIHTHVRDSGVHRSITQLSVPAAELIRRAVGANPRFAAEMHESGAQRIA